MNSHLLFLNPGLISNAFSQEEAQGLITTPIPDADAHTRMDLTHLPVTTIDSASTKEIDDGLSVEHRGEGLGPRLWVHVADPSRWIPRNHMLDVEARRRAKTMYLPTGMYRGRSRDEGKVGGDGGAYQSCSASLPGQELGSACWSALMRMRLPLHVDAKFANSCTVCCSPWDEMTCLSSCCNPCVAGAIFMFPACLAAGPFSLRMGAPCCALSIGMVLNPDGSLAETTITPSTIKVTQRTTFVDTERLLGDEAELSRLPNLKALYQVSCSCDKR